MTRQCSHLPWLRCREEPPKAKDSGQTSDGGNYSRSQAHPRRTRPNKVPKMGDRLGHSLLSLGEVGCPKVGEPEGITRAHMF